MPNVPDPDYRALGVEIARLRHARGWSIERLAEAAGVGRRSIINLEGAHHEPRVATLWAIAHGLEVPLSDLVKTLGR
ncbi:helix-turn-helix transcriptional regulator [Microbacterium lacticum]|uniref:helix-turn-helix domain-containing protein n=1 Tax=Microbacterium lacticum TaxID=33885 RepID=UPI0018B0E422|nr:helix-turn-helix transcriptional regulator [Microbacterium lacticum]